LAEYEKLLHKVEADEARIQESLFGNKPCAEVVIAYLANNQRVGDFLSDLFDLSGAAGIYLKTCSWNHVSAGTA